jgi:hypothetical protein
VKTTVRNKLMEFSGTVPAFGQRFIGKFLDYFIYSPTIRTFIFIYGHF